MLKVKFRISYEVRYTADRRCKAYLILALPCGEGSKYLHPLLRSEGCELFGSKLDKTWGGYSPPKGYKLESTWEKETPSGWREKIKEVIEEDWETLGRSIKNLISEILDTLRNIRRENESLLASKPEDKEVIFEV